MNTLGGNGRQGECRTDDSCSPSSVTMVNFSKKHRTILNAWITKRVKEPYWRPGEAEELAGKTGIPVEQLKSWLKGQTRFNTTTWRAACERQNLSWRIIIGLSKCL